MKSPNLTSQIQPELCESPDVGLSSIISRIVQKNQLPISEIQSFGIPFCSRIPLIQELDTQFLYRANIGDLWKILQKQLLNPQMQKVFSEQDRIINAFNCKFVKSYMHCKLILIYKRDYPQQYAQISDTMAKIMNTQHLKNIVDEKIISNSNFYKKKLKNFLYKQNIAFQQYCQMIKQPSFKRFTKQQLQQYLKITLDHIYMQIRTHKNNRIAVASKIKLIILYLKINLNQPTFYKIFMIPNLRINQLFFRFLSRNNGIIILLRFFQDASISEIKKEYEYTKSQFDNDSAKK